MIEKMLMVHIVTSASRKNELLSGLRELGILHLAEKKNAEKAVSERFSTLSKTALMLTDYAPKKNKNSKDEILSDQAFEELYTKVLAARDRKQALVQTIAADKAEAERIQPWGEFSPEELKELREQGYGFRFYRLEAREYEALTAAENVQYLKLADVEKMKTVAVLGELPEGISGQEFHLPEKSISALEAEIAEAEAGIAACNEILTEASAYDKSFNDQMLKAQNDENYSSAGATAEGDEQLIWISGYVPEADLDKVKEAAAEKRWAWAYEDVADDDLAVPTKVRYNKVSALIKPVFDILGILPGYREQDISTFFLLFFTLFFAMIIGDGAYGVIILLATIGLWIVQKKLDDKVFLLLVLSIATIAWGAITGTWFGLESAMNVPFLRALVIPQFANYPELFGLTNTESVNTIMKFSFSIGAIQMSLGSILAIRKKIKEKDLSCVADMGWIVAICGMYLLSLMLVIGEDIPVKPIFGLIIAAYLIVVLFGGMSPDKTFLQGLKSGVADAFTNFLNTISCFGNVMSYIRLFAVGMAGLAISQSFNAMASGFEGGLVIVGAIIVIIGHVLNLIMCFLSVIVHGVRLNVLEFSGQVGLEWTGIAYEPFRKNDKVKF